LLINKSKELTPRPPLYCLKRGRWCIKISLTTKDTKGYRKGEREKGRKGEEGEREKGRAGRERGREERGVRE
jgi:hypothetical protein